MRARGARWAIAMRWRKRDRRNLLVIAHGRQTAAALVGLTAEASTVASSILNLRWDEGADGFALVMNVSVHGGPVAMARVKAALRAVAEQQRLTLTMYPMSDSGGTG